ncbi:hypothetical protein RFI_02418 [Reticulomyxa filosa]|uniref:Uncharacterized protein n=1 Tax=Reticulomyxa filosa TaxID=46433 RepID=X6P9C9_RETFI|nr:hypothetical protein RFI_02418 [Reticulomyxa filosa]|eukprot:ETO34674.1 hypothetical protein RFI_02418 [Reticulomyxa filosa]
MNNNSKTKHARFIEDIRRNFEEKHILDIINRAIKNKSVESFLQYNNVLQSLSTFHCKKNCFMSVTGLKTTEATSCLTVILKVHFHLASSKIFSSEKELKISKDNMRLLHRQIAISIFLLRILFVQNMMLTINNANDTKNATVFKKCFYDKVFATWHHYSKYCRKKIDKTANKHVIIQIFCKKDLKHFLLKSCLSFLQGRQLSFFDLHLFFCSFSLFFLNAKQIFRICLCTASNLVFQVENNQSKNSSLAKIKLFLHYYDFIIHKEQNFLKFDILMKFFFCDMKNWC